MIPVTAWPCVQPSMLVGPSKSMGLRGLNASVCRACRGILSLPAPGVQDERVAITADKIPRQRIAIGQHDFAGGIGAGARQGLRSEINLRHVLRLEINRFGRVRMLPADEAPRLDLQQFAVERVAVAEGK